MNLLNKYLMAVSFMKLNLAGLLILVFLGGSYLFIATFGWIAYILVFGIGGYFLFKLIFAILASHMEADPTPDLKTSKLYLQAMGKLPPDKDE